MGWNTVFGVMIDKIWWRRNNVIFNNKTWSNDELLSRVKRMTEAIRVSRENTTNLIGSRENGEDVQVRWSFPSPGKVDLNYDGAITDAGLHASYGGVLRDENGNFLFGYAVKLGACSVLTAELWGILHGLRIT